MGRRPWGSSGVTMIECEGCQGWYHITCLGISPAKSKQFTAEGATATFHCPRCCEQRGDQFPFEPRVTAPQIKRLPSVRKAEQHLRKVSKLRVRLQRGRAAECIQSASRVHAECMLSACRVHAECMQSAC